MRPAVVQENLKGRRQSAPELYLKRVIVGEGIVAGEHKFPGEIRVWLIKGLGSQETPAGLAHVCDRQGLLLPKRSFNGQIPLIGAREFEVRIDPANKRIRWPERDCRQVLRDVRDRERNRLELSGSNIRKADGKLGGRTDTQVIKDFAAGPYNEVA